MAPVRHGTECVQGQAAPYAMRCGIRPAAWWPGQARPSPSPNPPHLDVHARAVAVHDGKANGRVEELQHLQPTTPRATSRHGTATKANFNTLHSDASRPGRCHGQVRVRTATWLARRSGRAGASAAHACPGPACHGTGMPLPAMRRASSAPRHMPRLFSTAPGRARTHGTCWHVPSLKGMQLAICLCKAGQGQGRDPLQGVRVCAPHSPHAHAPAVARRRIAPGAGRPRPPYLPTPSRPPAPLHARRRRRSRLCLPGRPRGAAVGWRRHRARRTTTTEAGPAATATRRRRRRPRL